MDRSQSLESLRSALVPPHLFDRCVTAATCQQWYINPLPMLSFREHRRPRQNISSTSSQIEFGHEREIALNPT